MRAWIEQDSDNEDAEDHGLGSYASICEYQDGEHNDFNCYDVEMKPKPYYIEYPEETVGDFVKVRVDIRDLSNSEVIDLLTALNAAGFEAVFATADPAPAPIQQYPPGVRDGGQILPKIPPFPGYDPLKPYVSNEYNDVKFG